tara:strand:- start:167 stop:1519 length:1353 start_codon:yes stop_codon:yes gene_type:complete
MARYGSKSQQIDTALEQHLKTDYRHVLRITNQSSFIYARDRKKKTQVSLKPLRKDNLTEVQLAIELCQWMNADPWTKNTSVEVLVAMMNKREAPPDSSFSYEWNQVIEITFLHLTKTMKGSSQKNCKADIRNLAKSDTPFEWKDIKSWLFQKDINTRPFKNRLDSLEQIRLALFNKDGDEPHWLRRSDLDILREQHNQGKKKAVRYQSVKSTGTVRAIVTREQAEAYFDKNMKEYPLQIWCLIMMMLYGLRNHELHHISPITTSNEDEEMVGGWVSVPGESRTKSKYQHWAFPLFPNWIEKYELDKNFEVMQSSLIRKAKPKIVSAFDKTKPWDPNNTEGDEGVCDNNDYLGDWITEQVREVLPKLEASVPDAKGVYRKEAKVQGIKPYDLRHTWAVSIATLPEWNHVSDIDAASAMGHNVEIHRKHYQKWISVDDTRKATMRKVILPSF